MIILERIRLRVMDILLIFIKLKKKNPYNFQAVFVRDQGRQQYACTIGFPENDEKQKGKKHRRPDLVIFQNSQGLYADASFFFVFHNFPVPVLLCIFSVPDFFIPFLHLMCSSHFQ